MTPTIPGSDNLTSTAQLAQQANPAPIPQEPALPQGAIPQEPVKEEEPAVGLSGYSLDIENSLLSCYDFYRLEDRGTRDVMIAFWRKLENYWQGIQRIFWDFSLQDWRRIPLSDEENDNQSLVDPTLYDKIINIYKAHGESIIAALSVKTPNIIFYPDDADVSEDIDTAKAYQKIAELICRHNGDRLLLIKALFILFNQGMVCSYVYNRESSEYGTVKVPQYGDDIQHNTHTLTCPICNQFIDEFSTRGDEQLPLVEETCNSCGNTVEPVDTVTNEVIPQIVGYSHEAKSRTIIDLFGPLYVHLPFYARRQSDIPYIHFNFEQHNTLLRDYYPNAKDKIGIRSGSGKSWDKWARSFNTQTFSDSQNLSTVTLQWLRPWAFECLGDDDKIAELKKEFPDGCYCVILNGDIVVQVRPENLDDHWEISVNPMSNFLHADPLGKPLAPVQEIQTEINDLKLETFEHSIPETFVDSRVLDFKKYNTIEARPGQRVPAKAPSGQSLADGFYESRTSTLSEEISTYDADMTAKGQFVTGAFPSIFGGAQSGGSNTAQEYTESRAMALQRLSLTWVMVKAWWAKSIGKATRIYANSLLVDEKFVKKSKNSPTGFENIFIKVAELSGKVGQVEPDADEDLPVSSGEIKSTILSLFQLANDGINEALMDPNNSPMIARAFGNPDFYIPGKGDRDKQYSEIADILNGIPTDVNPLVDNHAIHIEVLKAWLVSSSGIGTQKVNPQGFQALLQHLQSHIQLFSQSQPPGEPPDTGGNKDNANEAQ